MAQRQARLNNITTHLQVASDVCLAITVMQGYIPREPNDNRKRWLPHEI